MNNMRINSERGMAALIALIMVAMLTLLGLAALSTSDDDVNIAGNQLQETRAFYAAEAGLAEATSVLQTEYDNTGAPPVTMPRDTFAVNGCTVTYETIDNGIVNSGGAQVNSYTVNCTAIHSVYGAKVQLSQTLHVGASPMFQFALFGDSSMEIDGTCTDSYNSDSGTYASTQLNDYGNIGSNGQVLVVDGATIGGDAGSATPGGITITGGSSILGDTTTTADSVVMDLVPDSEYVWAENNSNVPGGMSGSYSYNPMTKALEFSSLTLDDGVYFFSSIYGQGAAQLTLAPGANVAIYVTGQTYIEHGSEINPDGQTSALTIFSKGALFHIEDSSAFYGTMYGPETYFYVEGQSEMFGSVYAQRVYMETGSCFHYDRDLVNHHKRGSGSGLKVVAWRQL